MDKITLKAGLYEGKKRYALPNVTFLSVLYTELAKIYSKAGNVKHKRTMPKTCLNRETTIRTERTCKKIYGYMRDLACRWLIFENAKIF